MAKSRNLSAFRASPAWLPVAWTMRLDLDLARNVEHFATYFTYRRGASVPRR